jgi:hypothetical protein
LTEPPSAVAVRAAVDDARSRAASADDEPAAVFYAFTRYRRAMPGAWRPLSALLTLNQARALGRVLDATADDLDSLASEILHESVGWPEVRDWFASRLVATRDDG